MPRTTMADVLAAMEALAAEVATLKAAPAAPSTASEHFRTGKRDANGNVKGGFPCTLGCGRTLKTDKAAASHDTKATHYHVAAK